MGVAAGVRSCRRYGLVATRVVEVEWTLASAMHPAAGMSVIHVVRGTRLGGRLGRYSFLHLILLT